MTHLIIEITDTKVSDISGTSAKSGKPYRMVRQKAYAHVGEAYPLPFEVSIDVENGKSAWPVGRYTLGAGSVTKGEHGIQLARYLDLVAIGQPKQG